MQELSQLISTAIIVKAAWYVVFALVVYAVTKSIASAVAKYIQRCAGDATKGATSTSLLTNVVKGTVYAIGLIMVLGYFGISIAPMVAALGVGGMAIALGLQDSLANFFAGLHLILGKQVRLGDHIRLGSGDEGVVTDITWRYTTLQTIANNRIVVPNSSLSGATLTNYDLPDAPVGVVVGMSVAYGSDLAKVERVALDVAASAMKAVDSGNQAAPAVRFAEFADCAIKMNVVMQVRQYGDQPLLRHEFIKAVTARFDQEGIVIPYPVITVKS